MLGWWKSIGGTSFGLYAQISRNSGWVALNMRKIYNILRMFPGCAQKFWLLSG